MNRVVQILIAMMLGVAVAFGVGVTVVRTADGGGTGAPGSADVFPPESYGSR